MKKHLITFIAFAFIFIVAFLVTATTFMSVQDSFMWEVGLTKSAGLLVTYVAIFFVGALNLHFFHKRIGFRPVLIGMGTAIVAFATLSSIGPPLEFILKTLPYYPIWLLAFTGAVLYHRRKYKKLHLPILLAVFPLIMSFGIYDSWAHWVSYGNWSGDVSEQTIVPYEFIDKNGKSLNNESCKDKLILLNFISIDCKPCWIEFPDFQKLYDSYQSNTFVETYAVAHLNTPENMLNRIEEKGYTFPVVQVSENVLESFDLRFYPTIILLDKKGKIRFKGELKAAEGKLESLWSEANAHNNSGKHLPQ